MLVDLIGITPLEALAVVIATSAMYGAMLLLVRLLGQRLLSGMSSFDLAAMIAFGSIIGRAALGDSPRLAGGLVALATLVAIQAVTGRLRLTRLGSLAVVSQPILLMAGRELLPDNLHRAHVSVAEVFSRLRAAGVRNRDEVAAVIFEPTGTISVIRAGADLDPQLLGGVRGAEALQLSSGDEAAPAGNALRSRGRPWLRKRRQAESG